MSQSEFDQYLALLSGLLRLNALQREAIASELRDHLEERLAELLAHGVPRHKAIETALEEFGDATGLAAEFVQIFRKQRRRWMMRMTLGTAASLAAIVILTFAFWPQGQPGPSPGRVVAQDEAGNRAGDASRLSPTLGEADKRADAELRKRLDFDFEETSLVDALDYLCNEVDLQFHVKTMHLENLGISSDAPVSLSLKQVTVEMGLDLMLEQLDLTYIIRDGVILVTSEEDLDNVEEVRVYNCRDLLATTSRSEENKGGVPGGVPMEVEGLPGEVRPPAGQSSTAVVPRHVLAQFGGGGGGFGGGDGGSGAGSLGGPGLPPSTRETRLMDIIMTAIVPDSWEQVGGAGTIAEFDGLIVIRHNPRIHRQVEQVLEMLREASAKQPWSGPHGAPSATSGGGGFF